MCLMPSASTTIQCQWQLTGSQAYNCGLHEQKAYPFATIAAFLMCYCHVSQLLVLQWTPTMYACNDAASRSGLEDCLSKRPVEYNSGKLDQRCMLQALKAKKATPITGADVGKTSSCQAPAFLA